MAISGNTKQQILEAAARLFAQKGYSATSISMIAREVGLGKSSLYTHFPSKENIFTTLIEQTGPVFVAKMIKEYLDRDDSPRQIISELTNRIIKHFLSPTSKMALALLLRDGPNQVFLGKIKDEIIKTRKLGAILFKRFVDRGLVVSKYSPEFLVWELISPLMVTRIFYFNPDSSAEEEIAGLRLAKMHVKYFIEKNFIED